MKPVYQTKFMGRDENGVRSGYGNCMQAAFASLFELPLEQVPNFVEQTADPNRGHYNMRRFAKSIGFELDMRISQGGHPYSFEGYYLAWGNTVRGTSHMVVYKDGELAHDPHPDGNGLISVEGIYKAIPYDPAKALGKRCECAVVINPFD